MIGFFRKKRERQELIAKITACQKAYDVLDISINKMRKSGINSTARAYRIVEAERLTVFAEKLDLENQLKRL